MKCLNVLKSKRKKIREVKGNKSKYSSNDMADIRPECYNCHKRCHYKTDNPKKEKNEKGRNCHYKREHFNVVVVSNS